LKTSKALVVVATVTSMTKALVPRFRVCTGYAGLVDGADQRQASCHAMPCHVYATKFLLITVLFLPPTKIPRLYTEKITIKTLFWKWKIRAITSHSQRQEGARTLGENRPAIIQGRLRFWSITTCGQQHTRTRSTGVSEERNPTSPGTRATNRQRDNARRAHSQSVETRRSCQTS